MVKKKVVVFGGGGFIGSHVADKLSELGFNTFIFDKLPSQWINKDQKMLVGDICDIEMVSKAVKGSDIVYNFAALADLNKALYLPLESAKVNIMGNLNILEACRLNKIKKFIYASTVYVNSKEGGFYRCSKSASENYVEEYNNFYQLNYTILRFGSLYGPRADDSNGLLNIIKKAVKYGKLEYNGHPDSMREYIHVEDAAEASIIALEKKFTNKCLTISGQEPMKVSDVLKMIGEILNLKNNSIKFKKGKLLGHYTRTPYAYKKMFTKKYIPPVHIDLGQGLLDLIKSVEENDI